ncbi:MAG: radical SAM protein [Lachnospiraceae bacterium]|nr:radical SAM protein [Lachnospiraceae bacterium]
MTAQGVSAEAARRAPVNRILKFSSVDGPGNRTVVFLQGCNMNCRYCHNPETRALCVHCGDCVGVCPTGALFFSDTPPVFISASASCKNVADVSVLGAYSHESAASADASSPSARTKYVAYDHTKCIFCDACIKACTHDASPRIRNLTAEETFREIEKQLPYIRGVTVSGGECTLYPDYVTALFSLCRDAGLTTLLDSNGTLDFAAYPELLHVTDGVMLDVKAWDSSVHRSMTDTDNTDVLRTLSFLAERGKLEEVRTVVVPGLVDAEKTIRETAHVIAPHLSKRPVRYKIIAFRPMGVRESFRAYQTPDAALLSSLADTARAAGMTDVVVV